jgi:hypothetical protein
VSLASGACVPCAAVDYSICGAAIAMPVAPAVGAIIKIGMVVGRLVRHFGGGLAVAFPTL